LNKRTQPLIVVDGQCAGPAVCPLSRVKAGTVVCIRELAGSPELQARLREMGLGEHQKVKLLSQDSNIICQVCNARLGISRQLAENILVEPVAAQAA
jgi:Fe2+ transport system protein FeoA